ncbi:MAG: PASTA domain-containing protein, partial [Actinobacteria bacterium]|nr:PASTA domain-containing protein [Actinomycetota bacterium]
PGTTVVPGSVVTIYVSPGGNQVPSVVGDNVSLAEGKLQNAGFTVTVVYKTVTGVQDGTVLNQDPHANGRYYPAGTQVTISVAKVPPPPSPTPSPTPTATTPTPTPTASSILPSGGASKGASSGASKGTSSGASKGTSSGHHQ